MAQTGPGERLSAVWGQITSFGELVAEEERAMRESGMSESAIGRFVLDGAGPIYARLFALADVVLRAVEAARTGG